MRLRWSLDQCVLAGIIVSGALGFVACGSAPELEESTASHRSAVSAGLTVSGRVVDANGLGRAGVTVTLAGSTWSPVQTDANGEYRFTGLAAGSYSVRPTASGCSFGPDVVNLNNLSQSSVQDFAGWGPNCGGDPKLNSGAMSGPLTIRGRVLDTNGNAVIGAKIQLNGATQAVRFTDFAGGYAFHVSDGSYSLNAAAACSLTPGNVNINNLSADQTQNFQVTGTGCATGVSSDINATGRVLSVRKNGQLVSRTHVNVSNEVTSAGALVRLEQIASEASGTVHLTIAGYPAVQRVAQLRGTKIVLEEGFNVPHYLDVTTAIAIDSKVVRFSSSVPLNATSETLGLFLASGRNFEPAHIALFTSAPPVPRATTAFPAVPVQALPVALSPAGVSQVNGEVAIAASDTSSAMVIGTSDGPRFSLDAGTTVNQSAWSSLPTTGGVPFSSAGDPEVAVGAPDAAGLQTFYWAQLSIVAGAVAPNPPTVALALFQTANNGQTFSPAATAYPVDCSAPGSVCVVPDQEMLAADRRNRAVDANGNSFDQLYLAWRDFGVALPNGAIPRSTAVACSADGGATWNINRQALVSSNGDFPRISVAADGSFLVAYGIFGANKAYDLMVHKFSSCAAGFQPQPGFPIKVATANNTADMSGMARQPQANYSITGSSNANTLFVAYAAESSPGNDDVLVARSLDGGLTWPTTTVMNTVSAGHRYFPSICSTGNTAHVSWFDRRAGTAPGASNDLTAYYRSTLLNDGASVGDEFNVTGAGFEDPQCLTGFPGGRGSSTKDAEALCTNLPNVLYGNGQCEGACAAGATAPCGSLAKCDFRAGAASCPAGETCNIPMDSISRGVPKYGDYAITDCAQGRVFMAWGSGTAPAGACQVRGEACSAAADCCSGNCSGGVCSQFSWSVCSANDATCTVDSNCCSGSCQGGRCFPQVQVYTQSTSCTGDVPSDLTCQISGPEEEELNVDFSGAFQGFFSDDPFKVCGAGTGFTPGGQVGLTYIHPKLPTETKIVGTADANGAISFDDHEVGFSVCTQEEWETQATTVISDEATGRVIQTFSGVPRCWVCMAYITPEGDLVDAPPCGVGFGSAPACEYP